MSDDRLRRLARATDDPLARARLLLERVRSGVLPAKRLELAAAAGDVDSRRALGWPEHPGGGGQLHERTSSWDGRAWTTDHDLASWVRRLASIEREAGLRAALAASQATFDHSLAAPSGWATGEATGEAREARVAIATVRAWVEERTEGVRRLIPEGSIGRRFTFWTLLALTARKWDQGNPATHSAEKLPTGARTISFCSDFLKVLRFDFPREVLEGPISDAVIEWSLRSETPVELSPPGNGPEVRTVPGRED